MKSSDTMLPAIDETLLRDELSLVAENVDPLDDGLPWGLILVLAITAFGLFGLYKQWPARLGGGEMAPLSSPSLGGNGPHGG